MQKAYCFDDVLLIPQYSEILSRKDVNISTDLGHGIILPFPVLSAAMSTVTEHKMAAALGSAGGLGIIHRYNSPRAQVDEALRVYEEWANNSQTGYVGIATGVTRDYFERVELLSRECPKPWIVCIDIAHGHHLLMRKALEKIRTNFADSVYIIAGNIATREGYRDLSRWGANAVKLGIGSGAICSTRLQTGHGVPGFQTLVECNQVKEDHLAKIILDGGVRFSGDCVKSFAAGADAVMAGSLLAGTDEAPGDIIFHGKNGPTKSYAGMASEEAQKAWRGYASSLEGISTTVPYKGPVKNIIRELETGIRSGLSYSGARNIRELQEKAKFVIQTTSGTVESRPHIL